MVKQRQTAGAPAAPERRGRGYFAVGVERLSKPMNAGNLFRTAHAFGASFLFTIAADYTARRARSDTSRAPAQLPLYEYADVASLLLPEGCRLVGIELSDEAEVLPSFHHPRQAAYVLGGERFGLSEALLARCDHVVRIPTAFSINLATAGAIVMYDRLLAYGRFARRPLSPLAKAEPPPRHVRGGPRFRRPRKAPPES